TGFDIDAAKMTRLDAHDSYVGAVAGADLKAQAEAGRLDWTTDFARLAECQAILICVPTPLTRQREPDLSFVEATTREIARHIRPGTMVVLESTTYPGTTEEVLAPILAESGLTLGEDIFLGFSPEREDPGNARYNTASIPKIVAGSGEMAGQLVESLYAGIVDQVVRVST
ncbi:MAG: UDP-N-acetyl-D-glucosamine dehydrogenase, partial [Acidimicrobiales bacterium]|nr:UDP-N-acetyl-D-glucosamine dehydrogenase [Acidimicrobiales bacterium]